MRFETQPHTLLVTNETSTASPMCKPLGVPYASSAVSSGNDYVPVTLLVSHPRSKHVHRHEYCESPEGLQLDNLDKQAKETCQAS